MTLLSHAMSARGSVSLEFVLVVKLTMCCLSCANYFTPTTKSKSVLSRGMLAT